MKKYTYTDLYNWVILGDDTHVFWCRLMNSDGFNGKFIQVSYYPKQKRAQLDQGVMIECLSLDEANFFVSKILKVYRVDIPEEFKGRYFKLKKLQKMSKCQSKVKTFMTK